MRDVILHAFNWPYSEIKARSKDIADCGYGAVLFPPPLYSDEAGLEWWQRYQPKDYRIIRSFLGGKKALEEAIKALHQLGLRVYADVVFNHMANEKGQRRDPYQFPGENELARYRQEGEAFEADRLFGDLSKGLFSSWDFNPQGDISNWHDLKESQEGWLSGLPDLELNDWVVLQQLNCLSALNALGFNGYRIDAIKHLPLEHIQKVFQAPEMKGKFIFGEALTANDTEENLFLWPLLETTSISYYDFPLHETMRRVFAPSGSMRELVNPAAFKQALPWHRAVTFSVTHDIPNNDVFRHQMLDPQDEYLANVYIHCRDGGVPLVFTDHNESAGQHGMDHNRWNDAWRRPEIARMIAFHNAMLGSAQRPLFEHDLFLVFARGDQGIVAINKSSEWQKPCLWTYGLRQGRYRGLLHDQDLLVEGQGVELILPPRQAQIWLYQES